MGGFLDDSLPAQPPYAGLVWRGSLQEDGTFRGFGFTPGTYTIRVPVSDNNASTLSELRSTIRAVGTVVEIMKDQDSWVEISVL